MEIILVLSLEEWPSLMVGLFLEIGCYLSTRLDWKTHHSTKQFKL